MQRYKISIEYDGTKLLGWQKQSEGPSVQGHLESILSLIEGRPTSIHGAGRTDAGVHAILQVAHVDMEKIFTPERLMEAINANLRKKKVNISILNVELVSVDFHARYSAINRGYVYKILNRIAPPALSKHRVWWVPYELDIQKMQIAANSLLGKHDFTSFRAAGCQAKSPIKNVDVINISKHDDEISITIEAPSFIHHQVRNIVGTLKMVGDNQLSIDDVKSILEARDRSKAGPTAPAHGLYLNKVCYK